MEGEREGKEEKNSGWYYLLAPVMWQAISKRESTRKTRLLILAVEEVLCCNLKAQPDGVMVPGHLQFIS